MLDILEHIHELDTALTKLLQVMEIGFRGVARKLGGECGLVNPTPNIFLLINNAAHSWTERSWVKKLESALLFVVYRCLR
jgi:hypothetical protein